MCKSVFLMLPKKEGATECSLHRTISLMSHLTKLLLRIIMIRIRGKLRPEISNNQFGFVEDRGTRNAIFTLSMIIERAIEMKKDLYLCFIDYSKAFDRVRHDELCKILNSTDIDGKDLRIVRNLYWEQTAATRIDDEISEYKPIKRGVRQGCVLSPDLFNIYSEMILRNIYDLKGIRIGGVNINDLRYADDTVLLAESESELQAILDVVTDASMEMGLDLNAKKTECMTTSKNADPLHVQSNQQR
ncbi:endonuclease-reverse transcriptase [Elysia marginata]|uniref:Endonuclease-reverse transcriptase n=1 Tax=Elysia marginata TaxID=1093978 RepID=A0AAV4JWX6_9GAST|nr:endonuclease-reverse transcriptase [Elysia marginata]